MGIDKECTYLYVQVPYTDRRWTPSPEPGCEAQDNHDDGDDDGDPLDGVGAVFGRGPMVPEDGGMGRWNKRAIMCRFPYTSACLLVGRLTPLPTTARPPSAHVLSLVVVAVAYG